MPELHFAEEATRYVLNELNPAERRRFEAELEQSDELRAQVRELEEGAVALALTVPRRQPPKEVWGQIERALARETQRSLLTPILRARFRRSGWAVATACLVGWGLSLFYLHRSDVSGTAPTPSAAEVQAPHINVSAEPFHSRAAEQTRPTVAADNAAAQLLQAKAQEISALRLQVADLSNRMQHLSEALTQERALTSGSSQIRFFQLTPGSVTAADPMTLSTNLQQALLLAMARELGWFGPVAPLDSSQPATNQAPVEFVDLRPGTNTVAEPNTPFMDAEPLKPSTPSPRASLAGGAVPGFVSGHNAVLAFDSSVAPSGSSLSFWTTTSSGQSQPLGSTTLGDSTLVVTVPLSTGDGAGPGTLTVFSHTTGGASQVFQFPMSGASPP